LQIVFKLVSGNVSVTILLMVDLSNPTCMDPYGPVTWAQWESGHGTDSGTLHKRTKNFRTYVAFMNLYECWS